MFDFMAGLNIKLKDFLDRNDNNFNNRVNYIADRELEKEINEWLYCCGLDNISFGDILLKIGIYNGKMLYLKKVDDKDDLVFSYRCDKLESNDNKIKLLKVRDNYFCQFDNNKGKILILNKDNEVVYLIEKTSEEEFNVMLDRQTITKIINGASYKVNYYLNNISILIKKEDGLEIDLKCTGNFDFTISNELELREYLINLTLNDKVFDVYRRICEISLGDESNFSYFKLTFNKNKKVISSLTNSKSDTRSLFDKKDIFEIVDTDKNVIFNRYLPTGIFGYSHTVKMVINNGDYKFVLKVKLDNLESKDYVKIDNELGLRDYFLNMEFPIEIDKIFKKICEISLGDISRYTKIELDSYYKDENINSLYLYEGNFKFYKEIRDGKEITVDDEGNFTYKSSDKENNFSMEVVGNKIKRYEYESDDGIDMDTDNRIDNPLEMILSDVKKEKVKTKKLIDEIIK